MSNPTREEAKEWSEEECGCGKMRHCRVFDAYLRVLDMRNAIYTDGLRYGSMEITATEFTSLVYRHIKQFDGGGA